MIYYVCGSWRDGEFSLVSDSSSLPYVCETKGEGISLFNYYRHNSNLYSVAIDSDGIPDMVLEMLGDDTDLDNPTVFILPTDLAVNVAEVVANEDFWS